MCTAMWLGSTQLAAQRAYAPATDGASTLSSLNGARVRVKCCGQREWLIGDVRSASDTAFTLATDDGFLSISASDIVALQRSLGTLREGVIPWTGAGAFAGAIGGVLLGQGKGKTREDHSTYQQLLSEIGVVLGGLTGMVIGVLTSPDQWQAVELPGHAALEVRRIGADSASPSGATAAARAMGHVTRFRPAFDAAIARAQ